MSCRHFKRIAQQNICSISANKKGRDQPFIHEQSVTAPVSCDTISRSRLCCQIRSVYSAIRRKAKHLSRPRQHFPNLPTHSITCNASCQEGVCILCILVFYGNQERREHFIQSHITSININQYHADLHNFTWHRITSCILIQPHALTVHHISPKSSTSTNTPYIPSRPAPSVLASPQALFVWSGRSGGNRAFERVPPVCPSGLCCMNVDRV